MKPKTVPTLTVEDATRRVLRTLAALSPDEQARVLEVVRLLKAPVPVAS
jgi:hypothetical protein